MEATSSTATQGRDWSSLPADLLKIILEQLPWSDHPRFAAACSHWRSVVSPFYPAWLTPLLLNSVNVGSTNVRYYSPYYHKNFELAETLETPNARLCCSNGHRLTLCQRTADDCETTVVDTNLVTGVTYDLYPSLESSMFDLVIYDGGKRMFGINTFGTLRISRAIQSDGGGWYRWESSELESDEPMFKASVTNPVLHHSLLYLLDVDGRLAVYDDSRHEEGFQVLDKPKGFGFECDECYLFESDESELMAVLMGWRGPPVHVVKLSEQTMEWEKVEILEGRALFTGTLTSMMIKTDVKWIQNKIFMPRLYDWPDAIQVDLVDREGELAFVPTDGGTVAQDVGTSGTSIWTCGLGQQESSEFWETIKVNCSIWVDFRN